MSVCCECCVLSGRGLSDELITRPEESYRLWCVVVCDLETSYMRRPWPTRDCCAKIKKTVKIKKDKGKIKRFTNIERLLIKWKRRNSCVFWWKAQST